MRALPPEVYALIISDVESRHDLFTLLLTSRIINHEAERVLYSNIWIGFAIHSLTLLSHLATCTRVAQYVQSLRIYGLGKKPNNLVCASLRNMDNLKSLSLFQDPTDLSPFPFVTLEATFSLRQLQINFPYQEGLKLFLKSQSDIRILYWTRQQTHFITPDYFMRSDLPALTTVSATHNVLQALLPNRNIKRFEPIDHIGSYKVLFPSIEVLSYDLEDGPEDQMYMSFPNLRYLMMNVLSDDNVIQNPSGFSRFTANFPHLKKVKYEMEDISLQDLSRAERFASATMNSNPAIRIVELFAYSEEGRDGRALASVVRFQAQHPPISPTSAIINAQFTDDYNDQRHEWQSWS